MTKPTLLVFAKGPRLGAGKTRLAHRIGSVQALRINRFLQAATLRRVHDDRWRTVLMVGAARDLRQPYPCVWPAPTHTPRLLQSSGDLGARLAAAFDQEEPVGVIGADCPDLTTALIADGFRALRRAPFALGPAADGGFWFFAARRGRDARASFAGVRWSSPHAAEDLLERLPSAAAIVRTLADIDTWEDWRRYRAARRRGLSPDASKSSSGAGRDC